MAVTRIASDTFRQVLGRLPTGVTVITSCGPAGPLGMAANSVTSVSLDPPLMLFCPARTSETWPGIRATGRFCINVMGAHHEDLTRRFAAKNIDRFDGLDYEQRRGCPALGDALAWIDCELQTEHEAGDHTIVVADVVELEAAADHIPLVFFRGRYARLHLDDA